MIHHVFANRSNIGDWLSARGIQQLLAAGPVTEHLCDEPFVPATLDALGKLGPQDFVIIGGGGLFMDYFTPFWRGFTEIAGRVPFCIWGAGLVDFKSQNSRAPRPLLTEIVRQSRLCVVRDELSREYVGATEPPVPCPSIAAIPAIVPGNGLLHVDHYNVVGPDIYGQMVAAGNSFAGQTGRVYLQTNNENQPRTEAGLEVVLKKYAAADLVMSSRLHGCILGLAMGRKVLAVSGDRKIEGLMNAARLGEWVLPVEKINALPARLTDLPEQPAVREFIEAVRRRNQAIAERVRNQLSGNRDADCKD